MISRSERKLDDEFTKLGFKPKIFHYKEEFLQLCGLPFTGITVVVEEEDTWSTVGSCIEEVAISLLEDRRNRAGQMIQELQKFDIYGVAICDPRDQFNRRYGRIKAKGRLIQHLKKK